MYYHINLNENKYTFMCLYSAAYIKLAITVALHNVGAKTAKRFAPINSMRFFVCEIRDMQVVFDDYHPPITSITLQDYISNNIVYLIIYYNISSNIIR